MIPNWDRKGGHGMEGSSARAHFLPQGWHCARCSPGVGFAVLCWARAHIRDANRLFRVKWNPFLMFYYSEHLGAVPTFMLKLCWGGYYSFGTFNNAFVNRAV